jgi:hypothetical protein
VVCSKDMQYQFRARQKVKCCGVFYSYRGSGVHVLCEWSEAEGMNELYSVIWIWYTRRGVNSDGARAVAK